MDSDTWQKKTHKLRERLRYYDGPYRMGELISDLLRDGDAATTNEDRSKNWQTIETTCQSISRITNRPPLHIPDKTRDDYGDKRAFGYYRTACKKCGTVIEGNWLREKFRWVGGFTIIAFLFPLTWCCSIYWFLFSDWRAPENCPKCDIEGISDFVEDVIIYESLIE